MGSFLSAFSSTNPSPDDLELQLLSKPRADRTPDPDWYSGRRHPLNPIGHFTPSFRRRRTTNTNTQAQGQALESPTRTNRANDPDPAPGASTMTDLDRSASDDGVSAMKHGYVSIMTKSTFSLALSISPSI